MDSKRPLPPPKRCIVTRPPGQMPRVVCPPGQRPKEFIAVVASPSFMGQTISSPLGGPSSGLSVAGPVMPAPIPSPAPGPTPPPGPTCTQASILTDCFPCTGGPINGGAPGPACGWTFSQAFGPKGGNVTFTPGEMSLNVTAGNEVPAATKPIALTTVNNLTNQWLFTEFGSPTGLGNSFYEFYVTTAGLAEAIEIRLVDDGGVFVILGPTATAAVYSGAWTPNNGSHEVHLTVDGAGVPTLWLDGIAIPLTFLGNFGIFLGSLPANVVATFAGSGLSFPESALVTGVFVSAGALPPSTEFCCA